MTDAPAGIPPSVLHVITHLGLGGAERVSFEIMKGLQSNFRFSVYAANGIEPGIVGTAMQRELEELGIPLHLGTNVPIKWGGALISAYKLARLIRNTGPEIVHLHAEVAECAYAIMAALQPKLAGAALIRTIHNSVYWIPRRGLGMWCERQMRASLVVGVSEAALHAFEELRSESGAGPTPLPGFVIYNGVKTPDLGPELRDMRAERDSIQLVFAGRLEDQKGVDLLPQVLARARLPANKTCELVLYGHGTYEPLIRRLQEDPPPGWKLRLEAPVPEFAELLRQFDLVLMPSRFEGLGLVAIEALLRGVPVIGTAAPGLHEVFPADYPWMARPGDAGSFAEVLTHGLNHPEMWAPCVRQAQPFICRRFDIGQMCAAYQDAYQRAMSVPRAAESISAKTRGRFGTSRTDTIFPHQRNHEHQSAALVKAPI